MSLRRLRRREIGLSPTKQKVEKKETKEVIKKELTKEGVKVIEKKYVQPPFVQIKQEPKKEITEIRTGEQLIDDSLVQIIKDEKPNPKEIVIKEPTEKVKSKHDYYGVGLVGLTSTIIEFKKIHKERGLNVGKTIHDLVKEWNTKNK